MKVDFVIFLRVELPPGFSVQIPENAPKGLQCNGNNMNVSAIKHLHCEPLGKCNSKEFSDNYDYCMTEKIMNMCSLIFTEVQNKNVK